MQVTANADAFVAGNTAYVQHRLYCMQRWCPHHRDRPYVERCLCPKVTMPLRMPCGQTAVTDAKRSPMLVKSSCEDWCDLLLHMLNIRFIAQGGEEAKETRRAATRSSNL
ncbi:hypothetical protein BHE74_00028799 [Ensete ventricosum]|nr:hypothetical protein BHE74_00028799 [Ensete ventricosum]